MFCDWALTHPLLRAYHDEIWCRPCHEDRLLFEYLVLESFQAGLSWLTILKKKEAFEEAFDHFEIDRVAAYDQKKIEELLTNPNIVRHRRKLKIAFVWHKSCSHLERNMAALMLIFGILQRERSLMGNIERCQRCRHKALYLQ